MVRMAFTPEKNNEQKSGNFREKHTLSVISMKSLASSSANARVFRPSLNDRTDRNDFANSSDSGSSCRRRCSLAGALFENSGSHRRQVVVG